MPLRIAYTLEQCWHPVPGGSAVTALRVLDELVRDPDLDVVPVAGRHRAPPPDPWSPPRPVARLPVARPWLYETWNRMGWPRVERTTGPIDVCHSTVAIPAATRAAHVVTVHDVEFVRRPEWFTGHGARVMRAGLERCRAADRVICPSRTTADALVGLGFERDRLRVVPWGVDHTVAAADQVAAVCARHGLPARFVLFVGTLEPRKNLAGLAAAVARLDRRLPLVVAGARGWGGSPVVGDADVRFLGFVPDAELPALYAAAAVAAYPSHGEGFGMPILEAMVQGTPVVTSAGGATEEVADGAAVLADPHDPDSIATALAAALDDPERWATAGRERAARASWSAAAAATAAVYREVAR